MDTLRTLNSAHGVQWYFQILEFRLNLHLSGRAKCLCIVRIVHYVVLSRVWSSRMKKVH